LYNSPDYHQNVRKAGIDYICAHPEQFIESIAGKSWCEYIIDMSHQGTWCDALMVQAVAVALNCIIDITESAVNFSETTIVHPTNSIQNPNTIYIGHLGEFHYVSTISIVRPEKKLDCEKLSKSGLAGMRKDVSLQRSQNTKSTFPPLNCYITEKKTKKRQLNTKVKSSIEKRRVDKFIESFHNSIQFGPEYICTCCDQLWYRSSVQLCNSGKYNLCSPNMIKMCITDVKSVNNNERICNGCHSNLLAGKLPVFSKANNMSFPEKPEILNLTSLEERIISPNIPFMQLRELPRGGQLNIHGNVVNVPADVNTTVNCLPRPLNESQTIPLKLKRRIAYKHHYLLERRPLKVLKAAKYLVETSQLFKDEGIDTSYLDTCNQYSNESNPLQLNINEARCQEFGQLCDETDLWSEVEERPAGVMDTLLVEPDVTQDYKISIRKCKTKGKKYTAQDFKTEDGVKKIINLDEGYRVLRNLRGSPAYFEKCKKDLFAMIRQLGNPTWFRSFSVAETRWPHLLNILGRIVEKKNYTDDEIRDMTWQKKSELIRKDPVTCARNFEHMFRLLLGKFLKSKQMPIGEIHDFFYRVE
jgi:hypothetical protein